jgi:hypothetical protein
MGSMNILERFSEWILEFLICIAGRNLMIGIGRRTRIYKYFINRVKKFREDRRFAFIPKWGEVFASPPSQVLTLRSSRTMAEALEEPAYIEYSGVR